MNTAIYHRTNLLTPFSEADTEPNTCRLISPRSKQNVIPIKFPKLQGDDTQQLLATETNTSQTKWDSMKTRIIFCWSHIDSNCTDLDFKPRSHLLWKRKIGPAANIIAVRDIKFDCWAQPLSYVRVIIHIYNIQNTKTNILIDSTVSARYVHNIPQKFAKWSSHTWFFPDKTQLGFELLSETLPKSSRKYVRLYFSINKYESTCLLF